MSFTRRRLLAVSAAAATALATGCSASSSTGGEATPSAADAAFPVTVKHTFGEAVIPAAPTRVLTWGYGSADAVLALGVVPIAIPVQAYGGDEQGLLPWIAEKLTSLGAATPTMLSNPDGAAVPFEEIAKAAPDVILAPYSGITAEDYAKLDKIAPTVAYPDQAWATPWREVVTMVGAALGKTAEAEKLLADSDAVVKQKAAEHPELAGKTVAAVADIGGTFYVYREADPRAEFLTDLGMVTAPSVEELSTDESTFYYTLSHEQLDKLTSDVLVVYAPTQAELDTFLGQSYAKAMPQIATQAYAPVVGEEKVTAVSPPTILSITWTLDEFATALSTAAKASG